MADIPLSTIVGGGRTIPASIQGMTPSGNLSQVIFSQLSAAGVNGAAIGSTTAGVYKTVLDISTPGVLLLCAAARGDTTARQVGLKITINGSVFYEMFDASSGSPGRGPVGAGFVSTSSVAPSNYAFDALKVEVKSSLTETDKINAYIVYTLDA